MAESRQVRNRQARQGQVKAARITRRRWPLLGLVLLSCGAGGAVWDVARATATPVTITIETASSVRVTSRAGLLLGDYPLDGPPPALLAALHPALIRVRDWGLYDRASAVGASYEFVLSELWGYPPNNYRNLGVPAYDALDRWGELVRNAAHQAHGRTNLRWDVWNESNWPKFFVGTPQQFFAVYLRAYQQVRSELGADAVIGGPSLAVFDLQFLRDFLQFCVQNQCQVNFLSWHEATEPPHDPAIITLHAQQARALAAEPQFRSVAVRQIEINETVGPDDQYFPASAMVDLYALEQGGVDLGARACWNDMVGENNCFDDSLDGLVVPHGTEPLATWWLYKSYADSLAARLPAHVDGANVVAFASRPGPGTVQVMVGYYRGGATGNRPAKIVLKGPHPIGPATVDVRIIPVLGETPVPALPSAAHFTADATQPITIPDLQLNQVAVITITAN